MNRLYTRITTALINTMLVVFLLPGDSAHAAVINSYFGWNLCCNASVPAPLEITSITYIGGSGLTTTTVPAFPGPFGVGMPDLPTFVAAPTYSSAGDGETTRTIGATMAIDWDMSTYAYPSIDLIEFTVFDGSGVSVASILAGSYTVGLIPLGPDTELSSSLAGFQGDIYAGLAGTPGNAVVLAGFYAGPLASVLAEVSFAAAEAPVVPVPAAVWLFGSALGLLGWMKRRS